MNPTDTAPDAQSLSTDQWWMRVLQRMADETPLVKGRPTIEADALRVAVQTMKARMHPMTDRPNLADDYRQMADAAEMLWVVLANVSGGDWTKQTADWQEAASRWRDYYYEALTVYLKATRPANDAERLAKVAQLQKERPPHGH